MLPTPAYGDDVSVLPITRLAGESGGSKLGVAGNDQRYVLDVVPHGLLDMMDVIASHRGGVEDECYVTEKAAVLQEFRVPESRNSSFPSCYAHRASQTHGFRSETRDIEPACH